MATQVLHDGDIVEVDTNGGIVRILDKNDKTKKYTVFITNRLGKIFR